MSSGQSNQKKPAIVCHVLARAIRREHIVLHSKGCICTKRHLGPLFIPSRGFISNTPPDFSATAYFERLLSLDVFVSMIHGPGKMHLVVVRWIDEQMVGFRGLTVKTIPSSLDALSIALVVSRCRCWSEASKIIVKCQNSELRMK